jgi:hypothetical protein
MEKVIEALKSASRLGEAGASMLEVALALAAGGLPVFPCALNKSPLTPAGFKARTTDESQIRRWWTSHSDAMPGIVPGDAGLAALDVDTTQAALAVLQAGIDLNTGMVVATGGTSKPYLFNGILRDPSHIYVQATGPLKIEGVVVRQDTGYVIAPGARRGDRIYRDISGCLSGPQAITAEVTPTAKVARKPADPAPDTERALKMVAAIPNRCDREQWVAMAHMIHGALGEDGKEAFLEWSRTWDGPTNEQENERVWDTLPASNLGYDSLWKTAAKYGFDVAKEEGKLLDQDFPVLLESPPTESSPADPATTMDKLRDLVRKILDAKDDFDRGIAYRNLRKLDFSLSEVNHLLRGVTQKEEVDKGTTLADLLQKPELLENPPAVIPYFAWSGMKTLFSAREKTGKTTLAMSGVAAVTRGQEFLGVPTQKAKVLWLTEESLKILVQRALDMGVDPEMLYVVQMGKNPSAQLAKAVEVFQPQIIVIDTIFRFALIEEENNAGDWLPVMMLLDEIANNGPAILILAHSQKRDMAEYRGSSAIGGYVDAILQMKRIKAKSPKIREIDGKGRLYFGQPFRVHYDGSVFSLLNDAVEVEESEDVSPEVPTKSLVLGFLKDGTASGQVIAKEIGRRKTDVYAVLKDLHEEGAIMKTANNWSLVTAQDELEPVEVS